MSKNNKLLLSDRQSFYNLAEGEFGNFPCEDVSAPDYVKPATNPYS